MRTTTLLLFVLAQFIAVRVLCQEKKPFQRQVSFVISPAVLFLPGSKVGVQAGFGFSRNKWGGTIEAAIPINGNNQLYLAQNSMYVRFGVELKRFIQVKDARQVYLSLQSNYAIRKITDSLGTFYSKDSANFLSYDRADYSSPVFSNAIKLGIQGVVGKRFVVDGFLGVGVRTISTRYSNVVNPQSSFFVPRPFRSRPAVYRTEQSYLRLHLTTGVRFGYLLYRK